MEVMKKFIPFVSAALVTVLWVVLQVHLGRFYSRGFLTGLSSIVVLLFFIAAWRKGQDTSQQLYKAVLLGFGGLPLANLGKFARGIYDILGIFVIFLVPILIVFVTGHLARTYSTKKFVKIILQALFGCFFVCTLLGSLFVIYKCIEYRSGINIWDSVPFLYVLQFATFLPC